MSTVLPGLTAGVDTSQLALQAERDYFAREAKRLEEDLAAAKTALGQRAAHDHAEDEHAQLQLQYSTLSAELTSVRVELTQVNEAAAHQLARATALESELTATRTQAVLVEAELVDAKSRLGNLEDEIGTAHSRTAELEAKLAEARTHSSGHEAALREVADHSTELTALRAQITTLEGQLAAQVDANNLLEADRADLERSFQAKLRVAHDERDTAKEALKTAQRRISVLTHESEVQKALQTSDTVSPVEAPVQAPASYPLNGDEANEFVGSDNQFFDARQLASEMLKSDIEWRFARLTGAYGPNTLQTALPQGWFVQPTDGLNRRLVLVYRSSQSFVSQSATMWSRFIDLVAYCCQDHKLDTTASQLLLDRGPSIEGMRFEDLDHLKARIRWRRVAATEWMPLARFLRQSSDGEIEQLRIGASHVFLTRAALTEDIFRTIAAERRRPGSLATAKRRTATLLETAPAPASVPPPPAVPSPRPEAAVNASDSSLAIDTARLAQIRSESERSRASLESLEEQDGTDSTRSATGGLGTGLLQFARVLAMSEEHTLSEVVTLAAECGVQIDRDLPLINKYAERVADERGLELADAAVEIDAADGKVWVDPLLEEIVR